MQFRGCHCTGFGRILPPSNGRRFSSGSGPISGKAFNSPIKFNQAWLNWGKLIHLCYMSCQSCFKFPCNNGCRRSLLIADHGI